jgi:hypothetical protein
MSTWAVRELNDFIYGNAPHPVTRLLETGSNNDT